MKIIEGKDLLKQAEGSAFHGLALMGAYSKQATKNGGSYLAGSVECGATIPFKVWSNKSAYGVLTESELSGKIVEISGEVNEYGGAKSIIISNLTEIAEGSRKDDGTLITKQDFLATVYDADKYWASLENLIKRYCSEEAVEIFYDIFDDELKEDFLVEFAASFHHDNVKSGLLAHSTKVTKIATVMSLYPYILQRVSPDLLFLGCAIHDIGKIREYSCGVVNDTGKVLSHCTLGILLLERSEELIRKLKGGTFYNQLMAVIAQHHGDYGEPPRTLAAQIIHMLDLMESNLTSINEMCRDANAGEQIIYDGRRLM